MRLKQPRSGLFEATLTVHELSTLIAGARMSLTLMERDPGESLQEARAALHGVLHDFDRALERLRSGDEAVDATAAEAFVPAT